MIRGSIGMRMAITGRPGYDEPMTRAGVPGLEAPDAALEGELRARLDEVEEALQKAVRADFSVGSASASSSERKSGTSTGTSQSAVQHAPECRHL